MKNLRLNQVILLYVLMVFATVPVRAASLNVFMQLEQEFYTPLVPVTKNFRTCFKEDKNGNATVALCPEAEKPKRAIASPRKKKK